MVRVILFDAAGRRREAVVQLGVHVESITAVFTGGVLTVTGDDQDNTIVVARRHCGTILVNGGAVPVTGDVPTTNNTTLIQIVGLNGNDALSIDDSNGPMPPADLVGGEGDDTLTAARLPMNSTVARQRHLARSRREDRLLGGPGDDILIGGRGVDEHIGGDGDDQFVWNPGDGSDVVEGEGGNDTLVFLGANIAELMDASANGSRLRFTRNVGNIVMDCDGVEQVIVRALGGADTVTVNDLTGTQVSNVSLICSTHQARAMARATSSSSMEPPRMT